MPCLLLHNCNACPTSCPQNITIDARCHGGVQADTLQTLYFVRSVMYTDSMDGIDEMDVLLDSSLDDNDCVAIGGGIRFAEASAIRTEAGRRRWHILLVKPY